MQAINGIGVPARAEIIPFEHDEVILGMEVLLQAFSPPEDPGGFFMLGFTLSADTIIWYPFLFDTTRNAVRAVFLWLTLAIVIGYVVAYCLLKNNKTWQETRKYRLIAIVSYIALIFILALTLTEDGIVAILFYPLLALVLAVAGSAVFLAIKKDKKYSILCSVVIGAALIAVLVCIGVHFARGDAAAMNWLTNSDVNSLWLYIFAGLSIAALVFVALYVGRKDKGGFDTRSIAYAAICLSLSFALSYIRILKMPQGGSITIASLLPLMIYAIIFGVKKGVFTGMIYGFLQAIQDTYILHPAQFVLDYPAAFACIGLAGLFSTIGVLKDSPRTQFVLGALVAGAGRFLMHFLSGIFAFGAFAPEGTNVAVYSLTYQAVSVLPDLGICIFVGILLFSSKSFVTVLKRTQAGQSL